MQETIPRSAKNVEDEEVGATQNDVSAKNVKHVGLDPIQDDVPTKNVKDVGLDPIQDDVESAPKWPSEFKRMQGEIIELWHACNVSLVHRTYFFLLFKGDQSDSFYMEVELRRMSLLKNTLSRGDASMIRGQVLLPSSRYILPSFPHQVIIVQICFCVHSKVKYIICEQQEGFESREADADEANAEEAH